MKIVARAGRKRSSERLPQIFLFNLPPNAQQSHIEDALKQARLGIPRTGDAIRFFNQIPNIPFKARVTLTNRSAFRRAINMRNLLDERNHMSYLIREPIPADPKHLQCKNCYSTKHPTHQCSSETLCPLCLEPKHKNDCKKLKACKSCGENHASNSPECPQLRQMRSRQQQHFRRQAPQVRDQDHTLLHAQVQYLSQQVQSLEKKEERREREFAQMKSELKQYAKKTDVIDQFQELKRCVEENRRISDNNLQQILAKLGTLPQNPSHPEIPSRSRTSSPPSPSPLTKSRLTKFGPPPPRETPRDSPPRQETARRSSSPKEPSQRKLRKPRTNTRLLNLPKDSNRSQAVAKRRTQNKVQTSQERAPRSTALASYCQPTSSSKLKRKSALDSSHEVPPKAPVTHPVRHRTLTDT